MIPRIANFFSRIRHRFRRIGFGTKLTLVLVPVTLIVIGASVAVMNVVTYSRLEDQTEHDLVNSLRSQKGILSEWVNLRQDTLQLGVEQLMPLPSTLELISRSDLSQIKSTARVLTRSRLEALTSSAEEVDFSDVFIVRASDGTILSATNESWEGQVLRPVEQGTIVFAFFPIQPLLQDPLLAPEGSVLLASAPMNAGDGTFLGTHLVGVVADADVESLLLLTQTYLRRGGTTSILAGPNIALRHDRDANTLVFEGDTLDPIFNRAQSATSGVVQYRGANNVDMIAAYEWLPDLNLGLANILTIADMEGAIGESQSLFSLIAISMIVMLSLVIVLITNRAISPLSTLTEFVGRITRGEWGHRVPVTSDDEFGRLSSAFNLMLDELQESYRSLEDRVRDRTQLIRAASEVARDAVSIRDSDRLLVEVVNLISRRFGYYHVGVFLLDGTGENVVLQAASSGGGQRMLHRGHSLPVGKVGIVGHVAGTGQPRIAHDVGADAHFFVNPDLPETRSEMALPLLSGARAIGVLDVQSTQPNAFSEDDVLILQTMADQLAVAIENARLIQDQAQLAASRRNIIGIYNKLTSITDYAQLVAEIPSVIRENLNFAGVALAMVEGDQVVVQSQSSSESIYETSLGTSMSIGRGIFGSVIESKSPLVTVGTPQRTLSGITASLEGAPTTICAPLLSRGEAMGALAVTFARQQPDDHDLEVLELLASQVSVALENTRLMQEMQQSLSHVDALLHQQTSGAWEELLDAFEARHEGTIVEYGGGHSPSDMPVDAAELATDIALRGEIIGSLNILRKSTDEWTEDDQAILEAVADEVAGALEQARLMEELQRRATQLQTAAEIARDATGLLDLDTLLGRAVNLIRERFDFYHVSLFLLDDDGEHAVIQESTGDAGTTMKHQAYSLPIDSTSVVGHVILSGECYVAHDVSVDRYHQPNPLLPDTKTQLGVPLRIGDYVIGALDVQHHLAHTFSPEDIAVLEILSDQLAVAVQNARNYEEALRRAKREQAVMEITSKIRSYATIDDMLRTTVQEMRDTLGVKRVKIQLAEKAMRIDTGTDGASETQRGDDESLDPEDSMTEEGAA